MSDGRSNPHGCNLINTYGLGECRFDGRSVF